MPPKAPPIKPRKPHPQNREKHWVRDAALTLVAQEVIPLTDEERSKLAFKAIDLASKIWTQVEGRYLLPPEPEGETDG